MQFLSEPSGGSDVAGALTTAVRDGDEWILNGSKVWTTGAWWSDWGLCLARTNWDVPKHRGLTVFMFPIHQEGIEVHRIEMLNGNKEFCQEFLTDVRVPDSRPRRRGRRRLDRRHPLDVPRAHALQLAARHHPGRHPAHRRGRRCWRVARDAGRARRPRRPRPGRRGARCSSSSATPSGAASAQGIATGTMSDQASAIARLFGGIAHTRRTTIAFELAGDAGAAWLDDDGPTRRRRQRLPDAPGVLHRRRHHRDGAQRHQRAGARHAPRAHARPRRGVPRRPSERSVGLTRRRSTWVRRRPRSPTGPPPRWTRCSSPRLDAAIRVDEPNAAPELWFPRGDVVDDALAAAPAWRTGEGDLADHIAFDHEQVRLELVDAVPASEPRDITTKRFPTWGDAADLIEIIDVQPEGGASARVASAPWSPAATGGARSSRAARSSASRSSPRHVTHRGAGWCRLHWSSRGPPTRGRRT